jgi:hypothetical protein
VVDAHEMGAACLPVEDRRDIEFHGKLPAILAAIDDVPAQRFVLPHRFPDFGQNAIVLLALDESGTASEQLRRRVADDPFRSLVGVNDLRSRAVDGGGVHHENNIVDAGETALEQLERLARFFQVGNIADEFRISGHRSMGDFQGRDRDGNVHPRSVLTQADGLLLQRTAGIVPTDDFVLHRSVPGRKQHLERLPQNLTAGISEHPFRRRVPVSDRSIQGLADEGIGHELANSGKLLDDPVEGRSVLELG